MGGYWLSIRLRTHTRPQDVPGPAVHEASGYIESVPLPVAEISSGGNGLQLTRAGVLTISDSLETEDSYVKQ